MVHAPTNSTNGTRSFPHRQPRVDWLECTDHMVMIHGNFPMRRGLVIDQSDGGIGVLVQDARALLKHTSVCISTMEKRRFGEICHITDHPEGTVLGVKWQEL